MVKKKETTKTISKKKTTPKVEPIREKVTRIFHVDVEEESPKELPKSEVEDGAISPRRRRLLRQKRAVIARKRKEKYFPYVK